MVNLRRKDVKKIDRRSGRSVMLSVLDVVKFGVLIFAVAWFLARGTEKLGYHWQWHRVFRYVLYFKEGRPIPGPLMLGLLVTFKITGISLLLSFSFGLTAALFRLSESFMARALARGYTELIRNTPLLVQLFFIYFVLGPVLGIDRFVAAVGALSLFEGAYASEIFRAGIVSIPAGQWEAAFSLGLGRYLTYRHIVLPQAIRWILPPLTGQAISLIKDSALVSTIAIYDLTMQGQSIIAETYLVFEIWFLVALIYLLITGSLSILVSVMEKRFRIQT